MKLQVEGLVKYYDDKLILNHMSINVKEANVIAFIGPSGSGKSTLLRLIAGLESYQGGDIAMNDKWLGETPAQAYRKAIGFVFQDHNLFNHLSLFENVALVLEKVHGLKRQNFEDSLVKRFDKFGLKEHMQKRPHQVSGGQGQRASIVRALSIEPEVILLDEPTSSLDPILTYEVLHAIKQLVEDGRDVILVTHEIGFAKEIADYVLYMEEGQVVEHGPDILQEPKSPQLKNFLDKVLSFG